MNQDQASRRKEQAERERMHAWKTHLFRRAKDKIDKYTAKGASFCKIELRFPPCHPDDETSLAVAREFSEAMEADGYEVRTSTQTGHDGAYCEIHW